ncbi:hypothetical protein ACTNBM_12080 [Lachnospiraceae bacterium HCP1S3_C3]
MGLFGYIGGKLKQATTEMQDAQKEAERWKVKEICNQLQRTYGLAKTVGYSNALKSKCEEMNNNELKNMFDYMYNTGNIKARNAMISVMRERNLVYEDENGRIIKNY